MLAWAIKRVFWYHLFQESPLVRRTLELVDKNLPTGMKIEIVKNQNKVEQNCLNIQDIPIYVHLMLDDTLSPSSKQ